jgi:hypothetical protein
MDSMGGMCERWDQLIVRACKLQIELTESVHSSRSVPAQMPVVKLGIIGHVVGRGFSPPMRTLATWPNTIARHSVTPRPYTSGLVGGRQG